LKKPVAGGRRGGTMNQKDRPPWGDEFKPDVPPQYDDTADFSKSIYNNTHAPVPHNKNDHRHLDLEHHGLTY
jgi:hypothetical protein